MHAVGAQHFRTTRRPLHHVEDSHGIVRAIKGASICMVTVTEAASEGLGPTVHRPVVGRSHKSAGIGANVRIETAASLR